MSSVLYWHSFSKILESNNLLIQSFLFFVITQSGRFHYASYIGTRCCQDCRENGILKAKIHIILVCKYM